MRKKNDDTNIYLCAHREQEKKKKYDDSQESSELWRS